eukprot:scaffold15170_cov137-Isochrysis_galbana.AAC.1
MVLAGYVPEGERPRPAFRSEWQRQSPTFSPVESSWRIPAHVPAVDTSRLRWTRPACGGHVPPA